MGKPKKTFKDRSDLINLLDEALKDVKYDNVFVIGSLSAFLFHNDKDLPSLLRTTHDIDLGRFK